MVTVPSHNHALTQPDVTVERLGGGRRDELVKARREVEHVLPKMVVSEMAFEVRQGGVWRWVNLNRVKGRRVWLRPLVLGATTITHAEVTPYILGWMGCWCGVLAMNSSTGAMQALPRHQPRHHPNTRKWLNTDTHHQRHVSTVRWRVWCSTCMSKVRVCEEAKPSVMSTTTAHVFVVRSTSHEYNTAVLLLCMDVLMSQTCT